MTAITPGLSTQLSSAAKPLAELAKVVSLPKCSCWLSVAWPTQAPLSLAMSIPTTHLSGALGEGSGALREQQ